MTMMTLMPRPRLRACPALRGLLVLATLLSPAAAGAASVVPTPPAVDARAHLLLDFHSGRVLAESNVDEPLEPASLTSTLR